MTESELYYFAGKCLALDENPEFRIQVIELCENNLIDWYHFVAICSDNYILPALYIKFRKNTILQYLPDAVQELLLEIYELNYERNKAILEQVKSINSVLNQHKIFPTYLKGVGSLIDDIYSDYGERMMIDIDFMVPEEDFLTTAEIMLNNGYLCYKDIEILEPWKWKHYPPIYHPDFPVSIEIHRIPTHHKCNWFNYYIIDAAKKPSAILKGCFVPSSTHKIMHNFIHSQLSHKGSLFGNTLLRDIYDLHLLSKQVSLAETLPQIKRKKKAIAYFAFARTELGFDETFFAEQNPKYYILKKKHELILDSVLFRKMYHGLVNSFLIVKDRYIGKFIKAFYSKEIQRSIKRKLLYRTS